MHPHVQTALAWAAFALIAFFTWKKLFSPLGKRLSYLWALALTALQTILVPLVVAVVDRWNGSLLILAPATGVLALLAWRRRHDLGD